MYMIDYMIDYIIDDLSFYSVQRLNDRECLLSDWL